MSRRNLIRWAVTGAVVLLPPYSHAFLDALISPQGAAQLFQAGQAVDAAGAAAAGNKAPANAAAQAALAAACKGNGNPACAAVPKMAFTRPPEQLDKLFTGEPIDGDMLMTEMRTLRSAIGTHNLNNAMASLLGPVATAGANPAAASSGGLFSGNFFSSIVGSATDALLDMLVAELSYQALDAFFTHMTDKPGVLKEVQVTLPKPDVPMTPEMKQQLVTMASFLVAIKASGKIIDASERDFEAAKESYRKVLDSRAAAARLLGDAFYARAGLFASQQEGKARGEQFLSANDLAYLETLRDKTPEEFLRDFNAQNIALEYLRKSNPKEYADYRVNVDEFKTHYGAYARTALGATSMVGFSSLFLKRAKNMIEKNGLVAAPALLPLVGDGLTEVVSLVPRVQKTLERSPDTQDGSFVVKLASGETKRELPAAKVFSTLGDDTRNAFQATLFQNGQAGYFGQLGEKFPVVAGRILDGLVEKDNRKLFVKGYLQEDDLPDFSFQNALADNARKTREMKAALFRSAPAESAANEDEKAIAVVQKDVCNKLGKWDNSTLRRLLFANRDPKKPDIELALAGATIAIDSPGMKGIMEYEEMASGGAEHATTRKAESDRPAAKPAAEVPAAAKPAGKPGRTKAKKG